MLHVFVRNLVVHGYHGVTKAERELGQKFHVDIECKLHRLPMSDDTMESTVCYSELCDLTHEMSRSFAFNLIETFSQRLMEAILARYPLVTHVRIVVRKPSAPIKHSLDYVGVEMQMER
jgi:dihydroneopterin aldolase